MVDVNNLIIRDAQSLHIAEAIVRVYVSVYKQNLRLAEQAVKLSGQGKNAFMGMVNIVKNAGVEVKEARLAVGLLLTVYGVRNPLEEQVHEAAKHVKSGDAAFKGIQDSLRSPLVDADFKKQLKKLSATLDNQGVGRIEQTEILGCSTSTLYAWIAGQRKPRPAERPIILDKLRKAIKQVPR